MNILKKPIVPVILAFGLYFFVNFQRVAIPGNIFNELQSDFHVSAPYITGLGAAFMYIYAVNQLFAGLLNDRFGGIRVMLAGAIPLCIGSLLFPLSGSVALLYVARLLTGFGASMIYLSMVTEILRLWPKNGSVILSFLAMIGFSGGIMANAPFTLFSEKFGYRNVLFVIGLIMSAIYLLFFISGIRQTPPENRSENGVLGRFKAVISNKQSVFIILVMSLNFAMYYVMQTMLGKKFLEDCCQYKQQGAAWILSAMGAISAFCGVLLAFFCKKDPNRACLVLKSASLISIFSFSATGIILYFNEWLLLGGFFFCLLSTTTSISAITIPLLVRLNGKENSGTSAAVLNFCSYSCVALLGNIAGCAMNRFPPTASGDCLIYPVKSYLLLLGIMCAIGLITTLLAFLIKPTKA